MMNVYNKLFIQGDMGRRAKFTGARISRFPPPRIISIALMYTSRGWVWPAEDTVVELKYTD